MSDKRPVTLSLADALKHAERLTDSRPDLAIAQARAILATQPRHPQARLILGRAQRLTGAFDEARATLVGLAAAEPRSAATAHELGLTLSALGDQAGGISALERAVALKPDLADAWTALADILRRSGDETGADRAYLASVRAATRDPELAQAALALLEGRLAEAEPRLRTRLAERPNDIAALRMLAELAVRIGRLEDGITLLERVLELAPGFDAARELLARTLVRLNRPAAALVQTQRLLEREPLNPSFALLKASIQVRIGDQAGALLVYQDVLARHPHQPPGWMSLGHVLKTLGRQDEAIVAYRRALAQQPTLGEAWWSLANLKTVAFDDADRAAMETLLGEVTSEDDRLHLHFALGKALEDIGSDAEAIAHYGVGNRLRRAQLAYDADVTHDIVVRQISLFTASFLDARNGRGSAKPDPIFIVGLPRAGSTLVEQILATHSLVEGTMELPDLMDIAGRLGAPSGGAGQKDYPENLATLDPVALRMLGEEYLERTHIQRQTDKPFFIDKMPNNWMHAGLIRLILPNAKIIDARRHPLGCCLSAWQQHFARGQGFSYDLGDIGRYYRDYAIWMAHLDAVAPGAVHRVIYEEMVADTEQQTRTLLDYLGLPFEEACLSFWNNDRAVRTASSEQVRQPIFTGGVDRWQRFDAWLSPLKEALGPIVDSYPHLPLREE